jgi:hypothetical protein
MTERIGELLLVEGWTFLDTFAGNLVDDIIIKASIMVVAPTSVADRIRHEQVLVRAGNKTRMKGEVVLVFTTCHKILV